MQTKGQLMKSLHTAFSFAPPSILSLTICYSYNITLLLQLHPSVSLHFHSACFYHQHPVDLLLHSFFYVLIEDSLGWDGMQKLLPVLKAIADSHGVTIANVAIQYILNQKSVGAVMVGTRNSRYVASNIQTLEFNLTDEEMKTIRDFISQYPTPEGECYELERTSPRYKGIILTDRNNVEN